MRKERIAEFLASDKQAERSTIEIADALELERANVSRMLNELVREKRVEKITGKPVLYRASVNRILSKSEEDETSVAVKNVVETGQTAVKKDAFSTLVGAEESLRTCIQKGKAAIIYPPCGLNTLLVGSTGVGKTMFATLMHQFAKETGIIGSEGEFVSFNCADYASNPQLLLSHLFGSKKGAFTGADTDRKGLLEIANNGTLFLDEVHRLPPEGQEMLFYLLDHHKYKPLGGVDFIENVNVRIVMATTKDPRESILATLLRRIPMTIHIPPLDRRTSRERYDLLVHFFARESQKVGKRIRVSKNAIQNLLLYDCPGNIGQLENEIQLGCANGFVNSLGKDDNSLYIDVDEFSENVRQGFMYYRDKQEELDLLIGHSDTITFDNGKIFQQENRVKISDSFNLAFEIEMCIARQKRRDVVELDMGELIGPEIQQLLHRFVKQASTLSRPEFLAIADRRIALYVDDFLLGIKKTCGRDFSTGEMQAVGVYVKQMIRRVKQKMYLRNYRLLETKNQHPQEYDLCANFIAMLEQLYHLRIPIDEIAYLTMLICLPTLEEKKRPLVFILMHGESSAKSMANVVRRLIGVTNIYAYDMPLSLPAKDAYVEVKQMLQRLDPAQGLLMLVDMGSLKVFGELLSSELGISVRVLDMVSTPIALECARLTLTYNSVEDIYDVVKREVTATSSIGNAGSEPYLLRDGQPVIVTMCMTGEGSAIKMKSLVESQIDLLERENVKVVSCAVFNREEMTKRINEIERENNIICIVGNENPNLHKIPFIHLSELLFDKDNSRLRRYIAEYNNNRKTFSSNRYIDEMYDELFIKLETQVPNVDVQRFRPYVMPFLEALEPLGFPNDWENRVGLIFHLACVVEKILTRQATRDFENKALFCQQYGKHIKYLRELLKPLEQEFDFVFREDDLIYMCMIVMRL